MNASLKEFAMKNESQRRVSTVWHYGREGEAVNKWRRVATVAAADRPNAQKPTPDVAVVVAPPRLAHTAPSKVGGIIERKKKGRGKNDIPLATRLTPPSTNLQILEHNHRPRAKSARLRIVVLPLRGEVYPDSRQTAIAVSMMP